VLALACVAASSGSLKELNVALALFADWLAYKLSLQVTRAGPHCPVAVESKLAWRKFVHQSLKHLVAAGAGDTNLTWKEWAVITKKALRALPDQPFVLAEISSDLEPLRVLIIRSPAQQGDTALSVRFDQGIAQQPAVDGLRYETIHQVKGETHDATVVVSFRLVDVEFTFPTGRTGSLILHLKVLGSRMWRALAPGICSFGQ